MITRADIIERVTEWGLTEEVVEKDYVLGWLLWGIGSDPELSVSWVFKGGTCLKKCYIETYRFSEDLDFTVLPGGPFRPEEATPILERVLAGIATESGIDFSAPTWGRRLTWITSSIPGMSVRGRSTDYESVSGQAADLP